MTSRPSTPARTVVTVVNSIGPTSMPFNEFVLFRAARFPEERHVVISWGTVDDAFLRRTGVQARGITVLDCRNSLGRLRRHARTALQPTDAGEPVVVHVHHPRAGLLFHLVRPTLGVTAPVLFTIHNCFDRYSRPTKLLSAANFLLGDAVTFVSQSAHDAYPPFLRRLRRSGVHVVPNGVDLGRVDAVDAVPPADAERAADGSGNGHGAALRLVHVGRFVEQKNHRFLVDVLRELPAHVTLTLVGEGPLRPRVAEWVRDAGLADRVRFTGLIPRESVYGEIQQADAFVSTSLWEGLPIAVLEAMALRQPVVLSDIGPHREIGRFDADIPVLPLHLPAWRDLLTAWATRSKEELVCRGERHRRLVESEFTLSRMHQSYSSVYGELPSPMQS